MRDVLGSFAVYLIKRFVRSTFSQPEIAVTNQSRSVGISEPTVSETPRSGELSRLTNGSNEATQTASWFQLTIRVLKSPRDVVVFHRTPSVLTIENSRESCPAIFAPAKLRWPAHSRSRKISVSCFFRKRVLPVSLAFAAAEVGESGPVV